MPDILVLAALIGALGLIQIVAVYALLKAYAVL